MRDFAPVIEPTTLVSAHLLSWQTHPNEVRLLPCSHRNPFYVASIISPVDFANEAPLHQDYRYLCRRHDHRTCQTWVTKQKTKTPTSMEIVTQCDTVQRRDTVLTLYRKISSLQLCNWIRTSDSNCSSNFRRGVHAKQNSEMLPLAGPTAGTSGNTIRFWHIWPECQE